MLLHLLSAGQCTRSLQMQCLCTGRNRIGSNSELRLPVQHLPTGSSIVPIITSNRCMIILYHYTETRAKYNAVAFLDGFSDGYLETDGYQGYNNLPGIKRCPVRHTHEDILSMLCRKESSTIIVIRQFREFSSAQSFLSMNADHRSKIFLLNKGKHIVSKKRSQYSIHSGRGWSNNDHAKGPASRRR